MQRDDAAGLIAAGNTNVRGPGFGPIAAGEWSRNNYAVYGDLEYANNDWTLGVAIRFEDFEDFGTTTNGKLAACYQVSDGFAIRGSVSTGFRAPTPGQSNAFNVSTEFDLEIMDLVNNGTIPASSEVAKLRGGEPLVAEESVNYALGGLFQSGPFSLTVDLYLIDSSACCSTARRPMSRSSIRPRWTRRESASSRKRCRKRAGT